MPYSSITRNAPESGSTPDTPSETTPEIVSGTRLPLGGHSTCADAFSLIVGGAVSTTHVKDAGVGSAAPEIPTARTTNVCAPSASPLYETGLVHGAGGAPSSEHSIRATAAAGSLALKVNVASRLDVGVDGQLLRNVS